MNSKLKYVACSITIYLALFSCILYNGVPCNLNIPHTEYVDSLDCCISSIGLFCELLMHELVHELYTTSAIKINKQNSFQGLHQPWIHSQAAYQNPSRIQRNSRCCTRVNRLGTYIISQPSFSILIWYLIACYLFLLLYLYINNSYTISMFLLYSFLHFISTLASVDIPSTNVTTPGELDCRKPWCESSRRLPW